MLSNILLHTPKGRLRSLRVNAKRHTSSHERNRQISHFHVHFGVRNGRRIRLCGFLSTRILRQYSAESGAVNDERCDQHWICSVGCVQFSVGDFSVSGELVFVAVSTGELKHIFDLFNC